MFDLIIRNARVVDGSGTPSYGAHVAVNGGKIAKISPIVPGEAKETIDAEGLVLSPGFIDSHSHDDMILETVPGLPHKLEQGITADITGMCGHSIAPLSEQYLAEGFRVYDTLCASGVKKEYETRKDFGTYINSLPGSFGPGVGFHIGHGTMRTAAMGFAQRKPTDAEMGKMKDMLRNAMENGALGISFGLIYNPGVFSDTAECLELCKVAAEYGGDVTIHMRNENDRLIESVETVINVVRETGIRCVISHHKAVKKRNWGKSVKTLELIEKANEEGLTVFLDQYPYTASSTGLSSELPKEFLALPKEKLFEVMRDPQGRKDIIEAACAGKTLEERFGDLMIGGSVSYPQYSGMMIPDAAKLHGKDEGETFLDVLLADDLTTSEIRFGMCDEDVERIMAYPRTMIGTDGLWFPGAVGAHPRAFASFPRVLGLYVREKKVMSLEEGIRRMTSMPAAVYGLKGKGLIREGFDADLCLFDPKTIIDKADYRDWNARCTGLKHVIIGGEVVVTDAVWNGKLNGRKLLRNW